MFFAEKKPPCTYDEVEIYDAYCRYLEMSREHQRKYVFEQYKKFGGDFFSSFSAAKKTHLKVKNWITTGK